MDEPNRRKFLIMAGVGAAATAGVAGRRDDRHRRRHRADRGQHAPAAPPATASGPLVAYVDDAGSGRVSVMAGEAEYRRARPRPRRPAHPRRDAARTG